MKTLREEDVKLSKGGVSFYLPEKFATELASGEWRRFLRASDMPEDEVIPMNVVIEKMPYKEVLVSPRVWDYVGCGLSVKGYPMEKLESSEVLQRMAQKSINRLTMLMCCIDMSLHRELEKSGGYTVSTYLVKMDMSEVEQSYMAVSDDDAVIPRSLLEAIFVKDPKTGEPFKDNSKHTVVAQVSLDSNGEGCLLVLSIEDIKYIKECADKVIASKEREAKLRGQSTDTDTKDDVKTDDSSDE